jgi:hypothetical protein
MSSTCFSVIVILTLIITGCNNDKIENIVNQTDNQSPSILVTYPADKTVVSDTITIYADAVDNKSVSYVIFFIDGIEYEKDSIAPFTAFWDARFSGETTNHTFYAKAADNSGNISLSNVVSVSLSSTIAKPTTIMPSNGFQTTTDSITFIWKSFSGALSYQIQLSKLSNFSTLEKNISIQDTNVVISSILPSTYYWRVRAKSKNNLFSKWSQYSLLNVRRSINPLSGTYGTSFADYAFGIAQTNDNGFLFGGYTSSNGGGDMYIVKTDQFKNKLWEKSYEMGGEDILRFIQKTNDLGVLAVGYTNLNHEYGVVLKTDGNGNKLWSKVIAGNYNSVFLCSIEAVDGYLVAGYYANGVDLSSTDGWLVKLSLSGDTLWSKKYGTVNNDEGINSIIRSNSNDGYILTGYSYNYSEYDVWIIKIDDFGNVIFSKKIGTSVREWGGFTSKTSDGGYIIAGQTFSANGSSDLMLLKLDGNGNQQWMKAYGDAGYDVGYFAVQDNGGNYFLGGFIEQADRDIYIVKADAIGNILWEKTFGGSGNDEAYYGVLTADNGIALAGGTYLSNNGSRDISFLKLNNNGVLSRGLR